MTVEGVIAWVGALKTGVSNSGKQWSSQEYQIDYDTSNAQYPKGLIFSVMGDKIEKFGLSVGMRVRIEVDFSVREWGERRFTNISAWKCDRLESSPAVQSPFTDGGGSPTPTLDSMGIGATKTTVMAAALNPRPTIVTENTDDLPF